MDRLRLEVPAGQLQETAVFHVYRTVGTPPAGEGEAHKGAGGDEVDGRGEADVGEEADAGVAGVAIVVLILVEFMREGAVGEPEAGAHGGDAHDFVHVPAAVAGWANQVLKSLVGGPAPGLDPTLEEQAHV